MAEGIINNTQSAIKYKAISGNITLDNKGYYNIFNSYNSDYQDHLVRPSGMNNFLYALMWGYGNSNAENKSITVDARGEWIAGTPNATFNGIEVRYYYTD
jgi:hypothetical protein